MTCHFCDQPPAYEVVYHAYFGVGKEKYKEVIAFGVCLNHLPEISRKTSDQILRDMRPTFDAIRRKVVPVGVPPKLVNESVSVRRVK